MSGYILALDQGTTSTRALLFNAEQQLVAQAAQTLPQHFPDNGWVEHDAAQIYQHSVQMLRAVLAKAEVKAKDVLALGITNQRETIVLWERATGKPLHKAIVWQDRRTQATCAALSAAGHEPKIHGKTGLLCDPYFSASKLAWLLDNIPNARARAAKGELACGTIDCWLIWQLTGGKMHATDATNASRTQLYNLTTGNWDHELLQLFNIPIGILPLIRDCATDYGSTLPTLLGHAVPIMGVIGDQQSAALAQNCVLAGSSKATYGTGCFLLCHTGDKIVLSKNRLLTTVAYQQQGQRHYALEGSIFMAGAIMQWLQPILGLDKASEIDALAAQANPNSQVYLVPAFVGLGAPYWDAEARGALLGMTRDTGRAEIAQAALAALGWQTADLMHALAQDCTAQNLPVPQALRVDGGMSVSPSVLQILADCTGLTIERLIDEKHQSQSGGAMVEATAMGAALLAGYAAGIWASPFEAHSSKISSSVMPITDDTTRHTGYMGWQAAVASVRRNAN